MLIELLQKIQLYEIENYSRSITFRALTDGELQDYSEECSAAGLNFCPQYHALLKQSNGLYYGDLAVYGSMPIEMGFNNKPSIDEASLEYRKLYPEEEHTVLYGEDENGYFAYAGEKEGFVYIEKETRFISLRFSGFESMFCRALQARFDGEL